MNHNILSKVSEFTIKYKYFIAKFSKIVKKSLKK